MQLSDILAMLHANRYAAASGLLFVIGFAGMVFNRNLFKKMVSMGFMDSAIFLFLTSAGVVNGRLAPIVADPSVPASAEVYANPLPAGLVLTGIVVSVSFTAFGLALTQRIYKKFGSLDTDEIMMRAKKSED